MAKLPPHKYVTFKMNFISAVDLPAQEPAQAVIVVKRNTDPPAKTQEPQMDPKDKEIATLKETLLTAAKRQEAIMELTGPQFDLFRTMTEKQQDDFLEATPVVRDTAVEKARESDPVIATIEGVEIRKSAGPAAVAVAKAFLKSQEEARAAREEAQVAVMKQRFTEECGNYPLTEAEGIETLLAIDTIKNKDIKAKALAAWKAGNDALGDNGTPRGRTTGDVRPTRVGVDGNPEEVYKANVRKYAEEKKISVAAAYSEYPKTDKGSKEYDAAINAKKVRDRKISADNDEGDED